MFTQEREARETRVWTQAPQEPGSEALKKCLEVWPPASGHSHSFQKYRRICHHASNLPLMLTQTLCLPLQSNTILLSPSCPPKSLGQHRFVSSGCCGQIRAAASKRRPLEDGKTKILQNIDVADRTKVQRALEHVQTPVLLFHTTVSAHP
jgi:hypothetical protein